MPDLTKWAELQDEIWSRKSPSIAGTAPRANMPAARTWASLPGAVPAMCLSSTWTTRKGRRRGEWWHGLLEIHNNGIDLETVEQRTGGGGRQKLFRAPMDWVAPTNKTTINVDIRGQGGFAMTAAEPARKRARITSGCPGGRRGKYRLRTRRNGCWRRSRSWWRRMAASAKAGRARRRLPAASSMPSATMRTAAKNYMRELVWAAVIGFRRDSPIPPGNQRAGRGMGWITSATPAPGCRRMAEPTPNGWRRRGAGLSLFANKWRRAVKKWDGKVKEAAGKPKPGESRT